MHPSLRTSLWLIACIWLHTGLTAQPSQTPARPRSRISAGGGVFMPSACWMTHLSGERLLHAWGETVLRAEVSGGWGSGWSMSFTNRGPGPAPGWPPPDRYYGLNTGLLLHAPLWGRRRWRMDLGSGLMAGYAWTRRTVIVDITPVVITTPFTGYGWSISARAEFRHSLYPVIPIRWELSRRLNAGQEIGWIVTAYRSLNGFTPLVAALGWSW